MIKIYLNMVILISYNDEITEIQIVNHDIQTNADLYLVGNIPFTNLYKHLFKVG